MMGVLEDIGTYLESIGLGVMDETIKLSQLPDDPNEVIALVLYDAGGGMEAQMFGHVLTTITPRVQVSVRASTYPDAEARAMNVFNSFMLVTDMELPPSGDRYCALQPINSPAPFSRDDEDRVTFVFNVMVPKEQ